MNEKLLACYLQELSHIREAGAEFAAAFPQYASRLGLTAADCRDPFVERLLEGFAFLTARVQLKLSEEFPRVSQTLLEAIYPDFAAPLPSMTIVQFCPSMQERGLAQGFKVERFTPLRASTNVQQDCLYLTAQDVMLWPIEVTEAQYLIRELAALDLPSLADLIANASTIPGQQEVEGDWRGRSDGGGERRPAEIRAALRITLQARAGAKFSQMAQQSGAPLDRLCFYLRDGSRVRGAWLYEQIFSHARAVVIQPAGQPQKRVVLPASVIRRGGFRPEETLFPSSRRSFEGYRYLREYFALPQRYLFFEVTGLKAALQQLDCTAIELIIPLDEPESDIESRVDASNFGLYCTPAVNLFRRKSIRIDLTRPIAEFPVVVDSYGPWNYEIYRLEKVLGYGKGDVQGIAFDPFFMAKDSSGAMGRYYAVNRAPKLRTADDAARRDSVDYSGSEVFISLVDAAAAPVNPEMVELRVEALCTNRELPLRLERAVAGGVPSPAPTFTNDIGGMLEPNVRCVLNGVTAPRPSQTQGEFTWRLINHLKLNYLSLTDSEPIELAPHEWSADREEREKARSASASRPSGAVALRELLELYVSGKDDPMLHEIAGLESVRTEAIQVRVPRPGGWRSGEEWPITFARGLEVTIVLDGSAFGPGGAFVLGSVLEQFFAQYVGTNCYTRTVVRIRQRDRETRVKRWPARVGRNIVL